MSSSNRLLEKARRQLYQIAGGSIDSNNVRAARLTTQDRVAFIRSTAFRNWVASESSAGRQVFWLKDVDMTQGAGEIFTFFFKWRADHNKFSPEQLQIIKERLSAIAKTLKLRISLRTSSPYDVLRIWLNKMHGGNGISTHEFWTQIYWPSQIGMTHQDKIAQVEEYAPNYAANVYPWVYEENQALSDAGVHVVIISNGDEELAAAAAPILGISPKNVFASPLLYEDDGHSLGMNSSFELFAIDWTTRPQPGKAICFKLWLENNKSRWGWDGIDYRKIVIAGCDGDSASADGGMMILLPPPAIGNFMINTPELPDRIEQFYTLSSQYGWTKGQFFTLYQLSSASGNLPI